MHLAAVVLKIRARNHLTIHNHMGLAIQRLFKEMMKHLDLTFDEQTDFQPYAVGGLMEPCEEGQATRPLLGNVRSGDTAWIRFVGLTDAVIAKMNELTAALPTQVEIDKKQYWDVIEDPIWDSRLHPWAGTTTYEKLWDRARENQPPQQVQLEFATPTTFKSSGNWIALPHPMLLFGSLDRKWGFFAPKTYHTLQVFPQFIEFMLPLSAYDCWSETVRANGRKDMQGFMGDASYAIRRDGEARQAMEDALQQSVDGMYGWLARQIPLLVDFAFYAGIGSKTAMGMGMVRGIGR